MNFTTKKHPATSLTIGLTITLFFLGAPASLCAAEIEIKGNSIVITNGDTSPDPADGTDFGLMLHGQSVLHTFTVANPGGDTLNLTGSPRVTVTGELDGFETGDFDFWSWTTGGHGSWGVQSTTVKDDGRAAKAPAIGDSQSAYLQVTADGQSGEVGFWYRVSSEAGWDYLRFIVDGVVVAQWSGEVDWAYYTHAVPAGSHTFRWEYAKDSYGASGADSAWLDSITLPVASRDFTVTVQPATSVAPGGTSTFNLVFLPPAAAWGLRTATVSIPNNDEDRTPYRFAVAGTVSGPDIQVSGNGVPIAKGDGSPSASDDTDFGEVGVTSATGERTFTISNHGNLDLTVSSITASNDFSITATSTPLPATVATGASMTFTVAFDPSALGARKETVTIYSNDSKKIFYTFSVGGTGVAIPEIALSGKGVAIAQGDTSPAAEDDTAFGMVPLGTSATRTFTLTNSGIDTLELTGTPTVLATGEVDGFETGDLSFWWWARGGHAGTGAWAVQSNTVKQGTMAAKAGAVGQNQSTVLAVSARCEAGNVGFWYKVSSMDGWHYLRFKIDGVKVAEWSGNRDWAYFSQPVTAGYHRFQWEYAKGDHDMWAYQDTAWLDSVMLPVASKDFTIETPPAASVPAGGSTSFEVKFRPTSDAIGERSAMVVIPNNDADKTPYHFMISATGTPPELEVTGKGTAIADGDSTPDAADDTDFGFAQVTGGTVARTFTINNTGAADLELANITASGDFAVTATSPTLPASVAPGASMTFTVTFDPSASALRTGTVTIAGEKATLHSFSIAGSGTREIEVTGNDRIIFNQDTTPSTEDGTDFGLGMVGQGLVPHTFTITNLLNSDISVTDITVSGDFEVTGTSQPLPATLAPDASMTVSVLFDPSALSTRRGTLSIAYDQDGGSAYTFSLQGTGTQELLVTSSDDGADPGPGTLRWALAQPVDGTRRIRIVSGTGTLQLSSPLEIASPTEIYLMDVNWLNDESICRFSAPADQRVTISGDGTFSLFRIVAGASLRIEDLTLAGGGGSEGGAFRNEGTLQIVRSLLRNNTATWGGAIWNTGTLLVSNTTFSANQAQWGGAVTNLRGDVKLQFITASQNQAAIGGGVLACVGGSARIHRSILWGNASPAHPTALNNPQITEEDSAEVSVTQTIIQGGHPGYYDPEGIATGGSYDPLILTDNLDIDPLLTPLVYPPYVDSPPLVMAHDLKIGSPAFWVCSGLAGQDRFGEEFDKLSQNLTPRDNTLAGVGAVYYNTSWPPVRFGPYWQDAEGWGTNTAPQSTVIYEDFQPITFNVYSQPSWQTQGRSWAGGKVYFTAPDEPGHPSCTITPNPATIAADNTVTIQCTANSHVGNYTIQGRYTYPYGHDFDEEAPDLKFQLTNTGATSLVVTNDADDEREGSLRWALANVTPGGVVTFDNDYTFTLGKTLEVRCSIDGGDHSVVFSGNGRVGVMEVDGDLSIRNLTIADGYAIYGGGAQLYPGSITFENVRFRNNRAGYWGGALAFDGISGEGLHLRLLNCLFVANRSDYVGGAIGSVCADAVVEAINCAFVSNSAAYIGGAVDNAYVGIDTGFYETFSNCVFWNNTASEHPVIDTLRDGVATVTFNYCSVQEAFPAGVWREKLGVNGGGNVDADPLFVDADGPDGIYGTADDDLRLQPDSPLLDAGDNAAVPVDLTGDMAGHPRITDYLYNVDTGSGTAPIVDIGPYEFASPAPTLASGPYALAEIAENDFDNAGTLVADILDGVATDGGMAIVGADAGNGEWQFSLDGISWSPLGTVSTAMSRLLAADEATRLRFVPGTYYNGTASVTFHAWNRTTGTNGGVADASVTGGMTAYSVDSADASITITPVNQAPTINAIAPQTINEGSSTGALPFTLGDIDNAVETLVVSGVSSNPDLLPAENVIFGGTGANRTVTVTPAAYQSGQVQVTITVSDGDLTGNTLLLLTVNPVNNAPTISVIPAQTIQENSATGVIAFTVADIDTPLANLLVSGTSANAALVPNTPGAIVCGGTGANRTVTVTPTLGKFGTAIINITVSDGQLYHSTSFLLTVTPVNTAPYFHADLPARTIDQDKAMSPTLFAVSDRETSAGLLQLSAASDNPTLVPVENIVFGTSGVARTVSLTPAPTQYGSATITVTVSDGELTAAKSFVLTVNHTNQAPVISVIPDQTLLQNSSTAAIPFTITDHETTPSSLTLFTACSNWTLLPYSGIVLGGSGGNRTVTITPAAGRTGTATVTISVSDGDRMTPTQFTVTVNATNQAPTLQWIADQTIRENSATPALSLVVGDVDDNAESLNISGTSNNSTLLPTSGFAFAGTGANRTVTITPAANQFGTALVTITVSDGELSASRSFTLTVTAVNTAPTVAPIADQSMPQDGPPKVVPFTVGDREQGAGAVVIFVRTGNSELVGEANIAVGGSGANRTLTISPKANRSGSALITLWAYDGLVSTPASFTFTVTPVNKAPTILPIADQTTPEDTATPANWFWIDDRENPGAELILSASSSNPGLVPVENISFGGAPYYRNVTVQPVADQHGMALITVTVSDGEFSASTGYSVTVTPVNDAPTATPIADQTIDQNGATGELAFTVADIETAPADLIVTATSSNQSLLPDGNIVLGGAGAERTVSLTPLAQQYGATTVTLTVSDGELEMSRSFNLLVNQVNQPPRISLLADHTMPQDTTSSPLAFSVGDPESAPADLLVSATADNPALVTPAGLVLGGSGSNRTLTVTPERYRNGTTIITLTVSDGEKTAQRPFTLTVTAVDYAPVLVSFNHPDTSIGLDVAITRFEAWDDTGVTGYQVTTTDTPPGYDDPGWSATPPSSFTVGDIGVYTLYPWVKDGTGNVSSLYPVTYPVNVVNNIIYVIPGGTGDCSSWANAGDLQYATQFFALPGYEIWVKAGTYSPRDGDGNPTRHATFSLAYGVSLYGGFDGTETARGQRDPAANLTIISGDLNGDDGPDFANNSENARHVFTLSGGTLDGVTIRGGNADGIDASDGRGGGVLVTHYGNPVLNNVIIIGNSAVEGGGVYFEDNATPILTNITLSGNRATGSGGGAYIGMIAAPTFSGATFSANTAGQGGGMLVNNNFTNATLTNVTFHNNTATDADQQGGGAIMVVPSGQITLINCTIAENSTDSTQWFAAGGMTSLFGTVNLGNTIVADNTSASGKPDLGGFFQSLGHNLIGSGDGIEPGGPENGVNDDQVGTNANPIDARLGALSDNGGLTPTMVLLEDSPALDAGDDALASAIDQRGIARPQGSHCDIGACERSYGQVMLTSSANPLPFGQSVTLTATVSPTEATGTVTFKEGETVLAAEVVLSGGSATCTTSALTLGSHTLIAEYSGDLATAAGTSPAFTQNVIKGTQSIGPVTFTPTAPIAIGGTTTVAATATSGLPIQLTSLTPEICSVEGTTVTALAPGIGLIAVDQPGDGNYNPALQVIASLVIGRMPATVSLGQLSQVYTGTPRAVAATTDPADKTVRFSYTGHDGTIYGPSATPPVDVGSYTVWATVDDETHAGSANGTLVIAKGTAAITLGNLDQTYDGGAKTATAATSPEGLMVTLSYNGSPTPPVSAGSYTVTATIADPNYGGATGGTLTIHKRTASVILGDLTHTYDGTPRSATVTTHPAGLTANLLYDRSGIAPTAVGTYAVEASIADPNYQGEAVAVLSIGKATQTITFDGVPTIIVETSGTLSATATSGQPVVFRSLNNDICLVVGNTVFGLAAGTATIVADQPGDDNFSPAPQVLRTLTVTPAPWTLTYLAGPGGSVQGDAVQHVANGASGAQVTAVPESGAEFISWSDGRTDNPRLDTGVNDNLTITASFRTLGGVPIQWFADQGFFPGAEEDWHDVDSWDFLGKGTTLLEEYVAMTDPRDASSLFHVTQLALGPHNIIDFVPNSPERLYSLYFSTTLKNDEWYPVPGQQNIPGGTTLQDTRTWPVFYRVRVSLPE